MLARMVPAKGIPRLCRSRPDDLVCAQTSASQLLPAKERRNVLGCCGHVHRLMLSGLQFYERLLFQLMNSSANRKSSSEFTFESRRVVSGRSGAKSITFASGKQQMTDFSSAAPEMCEGLPGHGVPAERPSPSEDGTTIARLDSASMRNRIDRW
jgi:hypothetical protein